MNYIAEWHNTKQYKWYVMAHCGSFKCGIENENNGNISYFTYHPTHKEFYFVGGNKIKLPNYLQKLLLTEATEKGLLN